MADAAQQVNEDGIPINRGPSAIDDELGLNAPQAPPQLDVSANPNLAQDVSNYITQGPDKAIAAARQRDQFVGPPAPAVAMTPPGAAVPGQPVDAGANAATVPPALAQNTPGQPGASATVSAQQAPGIKDLGDGTVLVPNSYGGTVRVAVSQLSPEARQSLLGPGYGGGSGVVGALARQDAANYRTQDRENRQAATAQVSAINDQTRVQMAQNDAEAQVRADSMHKQNLLEQDAAQHQAKYQGVMDQKNSDVTNLLAQQKQTTFDPDQYMNNRSAGRAALDAISVALGSIGQALIPGSSNVGLDMLHRRIEGAVEKQREDYRRLGVNIANAKDAYSQARQMKMDDQQATQIAKLSEHNKMLDGLAVVGSKYASDVTNANRQKLMADLQASYAKTHADLQNSFHGHALQVANMEQQERHFAWQQKFQTAQLGLEDERIRASLAAKMGGKGPLEIPGLTGKALTPEALGKAQKIDAAYRSMIPLVQRLYELRKKHSGGTIVPTEENRRDKAEAESLTSQLELNYKDVGELGALSGSDLDLVHGAVPQNPLDALSTDASIEQKYKTLLESSSRTRRQKLAPYGFTPEGGDDHIIDAEHVQGGK